MHVRWMIECGALIIATALALPCVGSTEAPNGTDKLPGKQVLDIVAGIKQAADYCGRLRLQDARSKVDLLNLKLSQARAGLTPDGAVSLKSKIDEISLKIALKEDSLVAVSLAILHAKGPDSALTYVQTDLKRYGVSDKKSDAAEKKILTEGPKVKRELERQALERTIKTLQNGQTLPSGLDPYILAAAKRAVKTHADSLLAIENDKKRQIEEDKKRQERLTQEKLEREKKLALEKAAKIRQDSITAFKRDSMNVALRLQQQKQTLEKEQQRELARIAKAAQDSIKLALAIRTKAREDSLAAHLRDSMAVVQRIQQQRAEKEKERLRVLYEEQKKQELADAAEAFRKKQAQDAINDSLAGIQKLHDQKEKERQDKAAVQDKAQAMVTELYDMIDKKQSIRAMDKFEAEWNFLVSTIDPEAYTVVQHAVINNAILSITEPLPPTRRNWKTATSPQRQSLDKINGFVREDKIDATYAEFKFTERSLANFMAKSDFTRLKSLVEDAYRIKKSLETRSASGVKPMPSPVTSSP